MVSIPAIITGSKAAITKLGWNCPIPAIAAPALQVP